MTPNVRNRRRPMSRTAPHPVRVGILTHRNDSSSQDWNPDPPELLRRLRPISSASGFRSRPVLSTTEAGGSRRTVTKRCQRREAIVRPR